MGLDFAVGYPKRDDFPKTATAVCSTTVRVLCCCVHAAAVCIVLHAANELVVASVCHSQAGMCRSLGSVRC
jgi:hypothetical protein